MKKTPEDLIKELELLSDTFSSNYALERNGYSQGLSDSIGVVKKHYTQCQQDNAERKYTLNELEAAIETTYFYVDNEGWSLDYIKNSILTTVNKR